MLDITSVGSNIGNSLEVIVGEWGTRIEFLEMSRR